MVERWEVGQTQVLRHSNRNHHDEACKTSFESEKKKREKKVSNKGDKINRMKTGI